jgi:hypothetical protein
MNLSVSSYVVIGLAGLSVFIGIPMVGVAVMVGYVGYSMYNYFASEKPENREMSNFFEAVRTQEGYNSELASKYNNAIGLKYTTSNPYVAGGIWYNPESKTFGLLPTETGALLYSTFNSIEDCKSGFAYQIAERDDLPYKAIWEAFQNSSKSSDDIDTMIEQIGSHWAEDPNWSTGVKTKYHSLSDGATGLTMRLYNWAKDNYLLLILLIAFIAWSFSKRKNVNISA